MSLVDFRNAIEKDGMEFAAFREEMRSEIIMSRLREREVDNKIVISESEIDNYLKSKNAGGNSEYQLAHILISVPENATPEEIAAGQSRVNEALSELAKGTDFAQVAAGFSDAEDALEGGLIGWKTAAQLPSLYVEALKTMKPGAVSNALRSSNGFHILKLTDKHSNAKQVMVDQTHVRHILIKPNEAFTESDVKNRLMQIKERLDNGAASFADMARQYSDDPSAAKGGDLGWISPGDTVPEFESTMNTLQPGQISEPVQTPFGWHLIEVVERRTQDMSEENARMQARQQIRIRKSAEAYEDWVRQLRDQAYVEYHLQDY
jgi:peptidyl-prolyl cis-trans isomerase SurA